MKKTVVVLVDAENISHRKSDEIAALTARLGQVATRKVYHRQKDPCTRSWAEKSKGSTYQDIALFGTPEKNKVDKKMIKDARRYLKAPGVGKVCVVSHDADFLCLANEENAGEKLCFIGGKTASKKLRRAKTAFMKLK